MQVRNTAHRYGTIARTLHWGMAALVIMAWLIGTFGDDLPKGTARDTGLFVHLTVGLSVLVLVVVRAAWRLADPPPAPEPSRLGIWGERGSRAAHYALYALLVAVPVVGIIVQFAGGHGLPVLGLLTIPSPWQADRALAHRIRDLHELMADALVILAGLHAAAALVHHMVLGDRTLTRMLPAR